MKPKGVKILLGILLAAALVVRVYRLDSLLGFWYDQGRDALVIWDFINNGKLSLLGPTTGIEGVFRGPWYYWLITPFYYLGNGNPVWPAVFIVLTTVFALYLLYLIGTKIGGKTVGFLSVFMGAFSYFLISSSRWLSNPTPMYVISMLFVYSLLLVLEKKKWGWVAAFFMAGMAMQFGSATEILYFLGIGGFMVYLFIIDRKKLPSPRIIILSGLTLLVTFLPQIVFDFRHQGILRGAVFKYLFEEAGSNMSFIEIVKLRLPLYYDVIFSKFFPSMLKIKALFGLLVAALTIKNFKGLLNNQKLALVAILAVSPFLGMLFLHRSWQPVYDYYFTGYYLIFILFFASVLGHAAKNIWGKALLIVFLLLFLADNLPGINALISAGVDGPTTVALGNQKQALNWIYEDADGKKFNVDVYVPPVIPYAYDYLFLWQGTLRCGESLCGLEKEKQIDLLYTLFEVDPPRPERLEAWLKRQAGIGRVLEAESFGGITVQRRQRL